MSREIKQIDNIVSWNYKKLHVFGLMGKLEDSIDDIIAKTKEFEIDFGYNDQGPDGTLYGIFSFNPLVDMNMTPPDEGVKMSIYSLNERLTRIFIDNFTNKIGLKRSEPDSEFKEFIENEIIPLSVIAYKDIETISRNNRENFEKAFWATRYASFLHSYKQVPRDEGKIIALKRFKARIG